jgi:hypothetical protein
MQNQELRKFVTQIIEDKKLTGVEQDIIDKLTDELTSQLEESINRALINSLNDVQLQEFNTLVDGGETQKISTFFTDKNLPVQAIVTETMAKFRVAYLGS